MYLCQVLLRYLLPLAKSGEVRWGSNWAKQWKRELQRCCFSGLLVYSRNTSITPAPKMDQFMPRDLSSHILRDVSRRQTCHLAQARKVYTLYSSIKHHTGHFWWFPTFLAPFAPVDVVNFASLKESHHLKSRLNNKELHRCSLGSPGKTDRVGVCWIYPQPRL